MVGKLIVCPISVSETKCIKIVGDCIHAPANPFSNYKWDYLAIVWDPIKQCQLGSYFEVSKSELELWLANS